MTAGVLIWIFIPLVVYHVNHKRQYKRIWDKNGDHNDIDNLSAKLFTGRTDKIKGTGNYMPPNKTIK